LESLTYLLAGVISARRRRARFMMKTTTACNRFTMKRGGDGAIAGAREGGLESAPARDLSGCAWDHGLVDLTPSLPSFYSLGYSSARYPLVFRIDCIRASIQWTVGYPPHPGLIGRRILLGAASSDQ